MTVKTKLALGAATSALLALCSCGGEEARVDPMVNDVAPGDLTELDGGNAVTADPGLTTNTVAADAGAEGNEAEGDGHNPEANESGVKGGGGNATGTTIVAVPAGPAVDRLGQTVMVPIPPPPPPPPPVIRFVPPPPPVHGPAVPVRPVRPR